MKLFVSVIATFKDPYNNAPASYVLDDYKKPTTEEEVKALITKVNNIAKEHISYVCGEFSVTLMAFEQLES